MKSRNGNWKYLDNKTKEIFHAHMGTIPKGEIEIIEKSVLYVW